MTTSIQRKMDVNLPLSEVKDDIQQLKINNAARKDGIGADLIKIGLEKLAPCLHKLRVRIWETEQLPEEWKEGVCLIYMEGDKPMSCSEEAASSESAVSSCCPIRSSSEALLLPTKYITKLKANSAHLSLTHLALMSNIVQKSLSVINEECGLYSPPDLCLERCVTLLTRDWNETVGLSLVYDRFFEPDPTDRCNTNRTLRCLQEIDAGIAPQEKCRRAAGSVQCYMDQYGRVNLEAARFVPPTPLQQMLIIWECGAMLGYSGNQILGSIADSKFDMQETRCLFRCYLIRSGMYSDTDGLNMERFYVACGGYEDEFYRAVRQCTNRVRSSTPCEDRCTLAQRLAVECIGERYNQKLDAGPTNIMANNGSTVIYSIVQNYAGNDINNNYFVKGG
ncbi:general odorant-binding protein 45-like [Armigeres subalbatus]|uniref:general odorant-binding protein 45-like n=1 Tax=Armigeres subalbatus TaxID=124917 RepID=UPI002ED1374A